MPLHGCFQLLKLIRKLLSMLPFSIYNIFTLCLYLKFGPILRFRQVTTELLSTVDCLCHSPPCFKKLPIHVNSKFSWFVNVNRVSATISVYISVLFSDQQTMNFSFSAKTENKHWHLSVEGLSRCHTLKTFFFLVNLGQNEKTHFIFEI